MLGEYGFHYVGDLLADADEGELERVILNGQQLPLPVLGRLWKQAFTQGIA